MTEQILKLEPEGWIKYYPGFIENHLLFFDIILKELVLEQEVLNFGGKESKMPRFVAWYGDEGKEYTYSRKTFIPKPWTPTLLDLKLMIERHLIDVKFNSCLVNYYRDGNDSIGWHADSEKGLGRNPIIASISLGDHRKFDFKRISDSKQKFSIPLGGGDLLVMGGDIQHNWLHGIKKTSEKVDSRINFTFRTIY